jgi:carbon storage regulator
MLVITRGCGEGLLVGANRIVLSGINAQEVLIRVEAVFDLEIQGEEPGGFTRRRQLFFTRAEDPGIQAILMVRRKGELFRIGSNVEVMLVDIRGDKARLGITAPSDCVVVRDEVYHRMYGHWPKAGIHVQDPRHGRPTREDVLVSLNAVGSVPDSPHPEDLQG